MPKPIRIPWLNPLLVVGCVSTRGGLSQLSHVRQDADVIEVRVDALLQSETPKAAILRALRGRKTPVLLTLRTSDEGGQFNWKSTERIRWFEELMPYADAIDVELRNVGALKPVIQRARHQGRGLILSAHSLKRKLTRGRLERWLELFVRHQANVYKLASLARTEKDLEVLVRFLLDHRGRKLAVMATGPQAGVSRLVLPALGSRLVYGYLDQPSAPGQPSCAELRGRLADWVL
ncbi:MAG: type I 3-dehydroquinate dehydratase [Verrucomicrobiia bacterium]